MFKGGKMFNIMYLKNPDSQKMYNVWHFCKKCGTTYSHHQSSWDTLKSKKCCKDFIEDISTKIDFQPVKIIKSDGELLLSKVSFPNQ